MRRSSSCDRRMSPLGNEVPDRGDAATGSSNSAQAAGGKGYFFDNLRRATAGGFRERQIALGEGSVINLAEGPSGGIPLLLVPGQGCVWQEYSKVLPELAERFHVVAVDVHGHGRSSWRTEDYTAVRIADDLTALARQVFGRPFLLAGHSSGGLVAALMAARAPGDILGVLFEDAPFFSTEPDRVPRTYVGVDNYANVTSFLAQDVEPDWVCWYMPRSYWRRSFGPVWRLLTRAVTRQRREDPAVIPFVRWMPESINRIWESVSHPYDLRFTATFIDDSWFRGFDQAATLAAIQCPTAFLKATTRHSRQGILLAALDDNDLTRVERLLTDNQTTFLHSSHDIHFAQPHAYITALRSLASRALPSRRE